MHFSDIIHLTAGLLQMVAAWYALRLGRILGVPRTGVLLFSAISLLAVAYLFLSFGPFYDGTEWSIKADTLYALFSAIMFVGLARLKYLFDRQLHSKKTEQHELQAQLETKIATLSKSNEDWPKAYHMLEQHMARLHAEIAEQKSSATNLTNANRELVSANEQLGLANEQLLQAQQQLQLSAAALQEEVFQQKMLLDAAAQAAADLSAVQSPSVSNASAPDEGELPRINNLLNGLDLSIGHVGHHLAESAVPQVSRIAKLLREHSRKLGEFMTRDPRGRQLPNSLAQLARRLADEHSILVKHLDAVKLRIQRLREITAPQSALVSGAAAAEFQFTAPADPTGFISGDYALQTGQTETGTTFEAPDVLGANLIPVADTPSLEQAPELLPEENISEAPSKAPLGKSETQAF